MLDALRNLGFLWQKLESILCEAESLDCHAIFIEEMYNLSERILNNEERSNAEMLLRKAELDNETEQARGNLLERISNAKAESLKVYAKIYVSGTGCSEEQRENTSRLMDQIRDIATQYERLSPLSE